MTSGGVTVAEVIDAVRRRKALLAPETAGYLVLGAADQVAGAPALIDEHGCGILVEGGRVVVKPSTPTSQADAERSLRRLLQRLLDASNGSAPALSTVAGLPAKGNVTILISELESALIPVNRGAAGRALSRLAREALRAREARAASPAVAIADAPADSDMELDFEGVAADELATSDDTEPIPAVQLVEQNLAAARESLESIDPESISEEPSIPHFPIEPVPPPPFTDEAITARAVIISEPPPTPLVRPEEPAADRPNELTADSPSADRPSAFEIDQLLTQAPSVPPPPTFDLPPAPAPVPIPALAPIPPPPPPPIIPDTPPLERLSDPPSFLEELALSPAPALAPAPAPPPAPDPPPVEAPPPRTYSSQAPSARGVDELLQDFMTSTTRKSDRVAHDLRHMTGVEASPGRRYPSSMPAPAPNPGDAPFQNASGTADFYTSTPPPREAGRSMPSLPDEDPLARRSTRRKVYVLFAVLALMTIGTVTVFRLKPGVLTGRTPEVIEAERREVAALAASIAARKAAGPCRATLVVSDVPQGAEVLVRSGIAPVDVDRLPSGARLEFVALSDGYAPRRGVVPQGAAWDTVNGKPRFELPIQLEKSRAKGGALDPWPPADPGSVVGGQGAPGTVHLITSPKGAEVWMVAGGSPEAKLEAIPCGAGMELLVAGAAQGQPFRRRLRVDASQLTPEPSANAATGRISAAK